MVPVTSVAVPAIALSQPAAALRWALPVLLPLRQEYEEAVKVMDEFLRKFPQGKLADEIRKQRDEVRKLQR